MTTTQSQAVESADREKFTEWRKYAPWYVTSKDFSEDSDDGASIHRMMNISASQAWAEGRAALRAELARPLEVVAPVTDAEALRAVGIYMTEPSFEGAIRKVLEDFSTHRVPVVQEVAAPVGDEVFWLYELTKGEGIYQGCKGPNAEHIMRQAVSGIEDAGEPFCIPASRVPVALEVVAPVGDDDFVEHSHPEYGSGYFCTPDVFANLAASRVPVASVDDRMRLALDAIYNESETCRAAVIKHYGIHHTPAPGGAGGDVGAPKNWRYLLGEDAAQPPKDAAPVAVEAKRGTDAQILFERKLTCEAIEGAMAFGYEGSNPPPEPTHWLTPFWELGKYKASLEDRVEELEAAATGVQPVQPAESDVQGQRMRQALERIAAWELPEAFDREGKPSSYTLEYGSNGARDHFRAVAAEALK